MSVTTTQKSLASEAQYDQRIEARAHELSEAQINYLSEVLGLSSFIIPESPGSLVRDEILSDDFMGALRLSGDLASSRLICLFHESSRWPLVGDDAEMATKMIFAMKLDSADVLSIEWRGSGSNQELKNLLLSAGSRPVLLFGIAEAPALFETSIKVGEIIDFDGVHIMPTHSLSELRDQPNLKKATWLHMQQLMKALI